jgi:hypothetical protein
VDWLLEKPEQKKPTILTQINHKACWRFIAAIRLVEIAQHLTAPAPHAKPRYTPTGWVLVFWRSVRLIMYGFLMHYEEFKSNSSILRDVR